jgi:hypothetical protein
MYYLAVDYFVIEVRMIELIVVVHDCLLCIPLSKRNGRKAIVFFAVHTIFSDKRCNSQMEVF